MKLGKDKLEMSDGTVKKFGSEEKRDNFERVAEAVKNGWQPKADGGAIPMKKTESEHVNDYLKNQYAGGGAACGGKRRTNGMAGGGWVKAKGYDDGGLTLPETPQSTQADLLNNYLLQQSLSRLDQATPGKAQAQLQDLTNRQNTLPEIAAKAAAGAGDALANAYGAKSMNAFQNITDSDQKEKELLQQKLAQDAQLGVQMAGTAAQSQLSREQAEQNRILAQQGRHDTLGVRAENSPQVKEVRDLAPAVKLLAGKTAADLTDNDVSTLVTAVLKQRGQDSGADAVKKFTQEEFPTTWKGAAMIPGVGRMVDWTGTANKIPTEKKQELLNELFGNYTDAQKQTAPARKLNVVMPDVQAPTAPTPSTNTLPTYNTPDEVPNSIRVFKTPSGRTVINKNYKG